MGDINFSCPECAQHMICDEAMAGSTINCPSCEREVTIPPPTAKRPVDTPAAARAVEPEAPGALSLEVAVADEGLLPSARAYLLFRACQAAQVKRPDLIRAFWPRLLAICDELPKNYEEPFEGLRSAIETPSPKALGAFAANIIQRVDEARALHSTDPEAAERLLGECEQLLRARLWPGGKQPAWTALVQAWAELNRAEGLQRLGKVPKPVRQNLLCCLNEQRPLAPTEWDVARNSMGVFGSIVPVITELLDRGTQRLRCAPELAIAVGKELRKGVLSSAVAGKDRVGSLRDEDYTRFVSFVRCIAAQDIVTAAELFEDLFLEAATSDCFMEAWVERFSTLRRIISDWVVSYDLRESAVRILAEKSPPYLRDFCLAHAYAMMTNSEEDADNAIRTLLGHTTDVERAKAWFLVTLVRRGLYSTARRLAQTPPQDESLLARLRRAIASSGTTTAESGLSPENFQGDRVGQFLALPSVQERVEFLRAHTANGSESLPPEFWRKLDVDSLIEASSGGQRRYLEHLYMQHVPPEKQFAEYLGLLGFGYYSHEDVDPHVSATLVRWDQMYPNEVPALLKNMWTTMNLKETVIVEGGIDVMNIDRTIKIIRSGGAIRSAILDRCRVLFPSHPQTFVTLIAGFIKDNLVGKEVYCTVGGQLGHITTPETSPFFTCLLGAQNVAPMSKALCDEIIVQALERFSADDDLTTAAGALYAAGKDWDAIKPPNASIAAGRRNAWQIGVVQALIPRLLASLSAQSTHPDQSVQESNESYS